MGEVITARKTYMSPNWKQAWLGIQYPLGKDLCSVYMRNDGVRHEREEPGFTETVARKEAQQVAMYDVGQENGRARARVMCREESFLIVKRDWRHMVSASPNSLFLKISATYLPDEVLWLDEAVHTTMAFSSRCCNRIYWNRRLSLRFMWRTMIREDQTHAGLTSR